MSTTTIIVDDSDLGRVALGVLLHRLRSVLGDRAVIRTASELRLPCPKWSVKPDVGARLNARIAVLDGRVQGECVIYLDGNHFIGDAFDDVIAAAQAAAMVGKSNESLRHQHLFSVRRTGADRISPTTFTSLRSSDFEEAAEMRFDQAHAWPATLQPRRIRPLESLPAVVDCRKLTARPWLSMRAPTAAAWCEQLLQAVSDGAVTLADIEADIEAGLLRPSAAFQVEFGISNPRDLPSALRDLDGEAAPVQLRNPAERRRLIAKRQYSAPYVPGKRTFSWRRFFRSKLQKSLRPKAVRFVKSARRATLQLVRYPQRAMSRTLRNSRLLRPLRLLRRLHPMRVLRRIVPSRIRGRVKRCFVAMGF